MHIQLPFCLAFGLFLLLGLVACAAPTTPQRAGETPVVTTSRSAESRPAASRQQPQSLEKQIVVKLNYLLYLPPGYAAEPDKKWPVILFLHGGGERGNDVNKVKAIGLPRLIEKGQDFPAIVLSPQCPAGGWWQPPSLIALLDSVQENYHVDPDRIYVTGPSMGGYGTWDLALQYHERFAAIVPICGGGVPAFASRYKNMGVWVFHGEADRTVPVEFSEQMVEAIKKAGGEVKFTRYPGVGHNSWGQTYDNPELFTWLFAQKRHSTTSPAKP